MKIAISPCPNDTWLFYPWIAGAVGNDLPPEAVFADIEQLNTWALAHTFPLIKLSFPCFAKIAHAYQLLPIGSALGFHCGPKIIAKTPFALSELSQKRVAVPGKETTAHFLLERLSLHPKEKLFCPYHTVFTLVENGEADCGVIIHESRFTYAQAGFVEIADLGEMWHTSTQAPLPLGGIAIARHIPDATKKRVVAILQNSLAFVHSHPQEALPFILQHSQEKDEGVVRKHIATYVNHETAALTAEGARAIETLLDCPLPPDWLFS